MKLVTFNGDRLGIVVDDGLVNISDFSGIEPGFWPPVGMVRLIAGFDGVKERLEEAAQGRARVPLASVHLEAPVRWPNKIIAFPANYHAHIEEMKPGAGGSGVVSRFNASGQGFFLKANSSLSGPADSIMIPPIDGREVHHECELGIIIGKRGRAIDPADYRSYVFGFTCLLDMVVRGSEERVMRKSYDTFCPIGPWIVTADEIPDFGNIRTSLSVNGQQRQSANTCDLIVDVPRMIAMASAVMTLEPGDIIASGTPAGVGPVAAGDIINITIDGVGSMDLPVTLANVGDDPVWDVAAKAGKAV